jgi:heme a synthase
MTDTQTSSGVRLWLKIVALMIFIMVIIGGATRLTDSGLSITEWQPIMGAIPPLSSADWQTAFLKYQQIPEFKLQNSQMTLAEFKTIFWWEWVHRFWGRLIGLAFALPMLWFIIRRQISWRVAAWLVILLALGAAQGFLGWFMVQSGLTQRTDVSQYRLAAHLLLASVLFSAVLWTIFAVRTRHRLNSLHGVVGVFMLLLVLAQIGSGAFVAGMDAGQGYNTWPRIDGAWVPSGLDAMSPKWKNLFENALTVQFVHRTLAYLTFAVAIIHALWSFRMSSFVLVYGIFAQACLGVMTLLYQAPLTLALPHQALAMIVLAVATWNVHKQTERRAVAAPY